MENITKEILKYLKNTHTKVETKEGFMGNYYSHLIDTIYIAQNFGEREIPTAVKDINRKAAELVMVCHECIHSIQNKYLHIANTILSNLSIVLAIIYIFIGVFWSNPVWFKIATSAVIIISIICRLVLEAGAVNGSTKLAKTIVEQGLTPEVSKQDITESAEYIKKHKILALLQMVIDKIIFLILVLAIK